MAVFKCDVFATKVANNIMYEVRSKSGGTREMFPNLSGVAKLLGRHRVLGVHIEVSFDAPCGIFWGEGAPCQHQQLERDEKTELYTLLDEACHRR